MNVLLIHNYYKHRGGEDAVFENEAKVLTEAGHNVIIYSKNNNEIDNYSFFKKITFFFSMIYNLKTENELKKIIKNNKINIAHIHNVFPLISTSAYKILKKNKIKIVQTLHNYRFLCPNGLFFNDEKNCVACAKGNFWHCIFRKCYKNSYILSFLYSFIIMKNQKIFKNHIDAYIALTEFTKGLFIKYGYPIEKFYVKDNGYIENNFRRKKSGEYFLFLGRISMEKGIEFLLESFKKMPQYNLIVAGTGDNLERYKEKYNYKNIEFTGFIDGDKKKSLIEGTEALIVSSVWYENYPISVVEAFCAGIPVIGTSIGGIPYIVEDGKNGLLFDLIDFDGLKSALDKMKSNANLREIMGDRARKTYDERMSMKNNIKRLIKIYEEINAGKS